MRLPVQRCAPHRRVHPAPLPSSPLPAFEPRLHSSRRSAHSGLCVPLCRVAADNQVVKLPINKFTVREREMLIGSGILPPEFFQAASNPFAIGLGARELLRACHATSEEAQGFGLAKVEVCS
jgi:hypothetical protein